MKYVALGGGLCLAYLGLSYLANQKSSNSKPLPKEFTRDILKEIKYQVYASCIPFAEGVNQKLSSYPKKDLDTYLRNEVVKVF